MQLVAYSVEVDNADPPNLLDVNWGRGNSAKGWVEGAWYPLILRIPNAQTEYGTNLTALPDMYIAYDFYRGTGGDGVYADMVRSMSAYRTLPVTLRTTVGAGHRRMGRRTPRQTCHRSGLRN